MSEDIVKRIWEEGDTEKRDMTIIEDKRQFSIRLPKDFAETLKETYGTLKKLKFRFILKIPPANSKNRPKLTGILVNEK